MPGITMGIKVGRGVKVGGVSYVEPSYANPYGSGDRLAAMAGLASGTVTGANIWGVMDAFFAAGSLFDGAQDNLGYFNPNGTAVAGARLIIDLSTLGTSFKVTALKFYFAATMTAGVWKPIAFINGAWVDAGNNFNLGASATQEVVMDATGCTKVGIEGVSETCSWDAQFREIDIKLGAQL